MVGLGNPVHGEEAVYGTTVHKTYLLKVQDYLDVGNNNKREKILLYINDLIKI